MKMGFLKMRIMKMIIMKMSITMMRMVIGTFMLIGIKIIGKMVSLISKTIFSLTRKTLLSFYFPIPKAE